MIIVGITFLASMGFCNSSDDLFRFISNIEIVVIDSRINGSGMPEPYRTIHKPIGLLCEIR